ncbi:MAG TPA: S41 family peptidase [bacterium]|jgi:carboxyl-terminal processing protease
MIDDTRTRRIFNLSIALIIVLSFLIGFQSAGLVRLLPRNDKMPSWASNVISSLSRDIYASPEDIDDADLAILFQVLNYVTEYYLYKDDIDGTTLIHGAAQGVVNALGDRYSRFVPPPDQEVLIEEIEGEYYGVGVSIIDRPGTLPPFALDCELGEDGDPDDPFYFRETRGVLVVQAFENGPAYETGIRDNDVITCVADKSMRGHTAEDAVALIKGPEGTQVEITVWRSSTQEELSFDITRRKVEVPTVSDVQMLDDRIGYIKLNSFNNLTAQDVMAAVAELNTDGMEGLIFDLRNNTGGPMPAAAGVVDMFVSDGTLVYYEDSMGNTDEFNSEDSGLALGIPLVVLINGNSASSSEIVAGAVRDTRVGLLVGETTYGKGVVQNVTTLPDGSGLVLTTGRYLTPTKNEITEDGITPDVPVNLDPAKIREEDPQIDEFLTRMDDISNEYAQLREEMNLYLQDHDFIKDAAVDVINDWIENGSIPDPTVYDF